LRFHFSSQGPDDQAPLLAGFEQCVSIYKYYTTGFTTLSTGFFDPVAYDFTATFSVTAIDEFCKHLYDLLCFSPCAVDVEWFPTVGTGLKLQFSLYEIGFRHVVAP
jgi:hypothetical protein